MVAERIRFHLDEQADPNIARALRRHGIDVTTTVEAGLRGASDQEQLAYARQERRVLVTHDTDFLRLAGFSADHFGIVYCHKARHSLGDIIRHLLLVYEILSAEEIAGTIEYV